MKTSAAYVYIIGNKENRQKIGFSKDPYKRLRELQTANSEELFLHHSIKYDTINKARKMEQIIHKELSYKRLYGEWFNITREDAIDMLNYFSMFYETKCI